MRKQGKFEAAKPAGSPWKKIVLIFLCVFLLLAALVAVGVKVYIDRVIGSIPTVSELPTWTEDPPVTSEPTETIPAEETTQPTTVETTTEAITETTEPDYGQSGKIVNILVVGQDSRPVEEHKLSDTIMLFTLNKEKKTLTITSFLRDSYVNLPDYYRGHTCGWNRINTAYALGYSWFGDAGAMDMMNVTIEGNYGVKIDGNVEISFDAFEAIVDVLGGLTIPLDEDETAYMNQEVDNWSAIGFGEIWNLHHFEVGENFLNGKEALWFASMRHSSNSDNDFKRAARQRLVVDLVLQKLKTMNPLKVTSLIDEILPHILTNISTDDIKMYIKELVPYIFGLTLETNQCPAEGTYWGEMVDLPDGPGGVLKIDFDANRRIMAEICNE